MNTDSNFSKSHVDTDALDEQFIGYCMLGIPELSDAITATPPEIVPVDYAHIIFRLEHHGFAELDNVATESFKTLFERDPRNASYVLEIDDLGEGMFMLSLDDEALKETSSGNSLTGIEVEGNGNGR